MGNTIDITEYDYINFIDENDNSLLCIFASEALKILLKELM